MLIYKMQKNIIQSQVQSLKKHPHIKKLQKIHNRLIQILYYPREIKSAYAQFQYRVKIELPMNFPEQPPTVKFIDPITHLNINSKSGQVAMPLLLDEWSPYISLYIIIDLLDNILVQPELGEQYRVGQKANKHHKQKTNDLALQKKPEDIPIFKTTEQEEISMIKKQSTNQRKDQMQQEQLKPIGTMKKKLKRLKTIILEKSQRNDLLEEKQSPTTNFKMNNEIDKIQEEQSFILNEKQEVKSPRSKFVGKTSGFYRHSKPPQLLLLKSQPIEDKVQPKEEEQDNIKDRIQDKQKTPRLSKHENDIKTDNKVESTIHKKERESAFNTKHQSTLKKKLEDVQQKGGLNSLNSTVFFEKTTNNLTKINKLIELFTYQLSQLQKKKAQTNNQFFTKIVDKKIEEQLCMLQELEELSLSVKKNMIANLKRHLDK